MHEKKRTKKRTKTKKISSMGGIFTFEGMEDAISSAWGGGGLAGGGASSPGDKLKVSGPSL